MTVTIESKNRVLSSLDRYLKEIEGWSKDLPPDSIEYYYILLVETVLRYNNRLDWDMDKPIILAVAPDIIFPSPWKVVRATNPHTFRRYTMVAKNNRVVATNLNQREYMYLIKGNSI